MIKAIKRLLYRNRTSVNSIHNYWQGEPVDEGNNPSTYITIPQFHAMSRFLLNLIDKYGERSMRILEIGCNAGRNLHYLYQSGFKNLSGIEINSGAVELMKKTYPDMTVNIYNRPVEDVIGGFPDNAFDIVYSVATFYHVHTDSNWIFKEVARSAGKYVITIENEYATTDWRHFPRNYKHVFEKLGMKQVKEIDCSRAKEIPGFGNFKARVFFKKGRVKK